MNEDRQLSPTVTVRPLDNGPLQIEGRVRVVDHAGTACELEGQDPVFMCRCGGSATKPFCDGSHLVLGFVADGGASR